MILQLKEGKVVGEYNTPTQASRESGVKATNITKVCKGIRRQAGGYEWKYAKPSNISTTHNGDYTHVQDTTYKHDIEKGTFEINTYYNHPPLPEEVIADHRIDTTKWKLQGYWSKGKHKGWLVSANFVKLSGQSAEHISEARIEQIVKKHAQSRPIFTVNRGNQAAKVLRIILTDVHIGMEIDADGTGMYGGKWDQSELTKRLTFLLGKVREQKQLYGQFSEVHILNLGDLHDGLGGETARKGHLLPQNMSDEQGFEVGVDFMMGLIEGVRGIVECPIKSFNITNDNHSPLMGYLICSTTQKICEAKYPDVKVEIMRSYINHYIVGQHVFILSHGKDATHLKFGFKPQLDDKGKDKIEEYMKHHNLYGKGYFVTFEKGDTHVQLLDSMSSDDFHYHNYMAFSPASGWVQHNFKKSRSGFNLMVVDKEIEEKTLTPYYFPWNDGNMDIAF